MNARWAVGVLVVTAACAQGLKVSNTYRYRGQGRYEWKVFVAEDPATLSRVNCVEYTLHPTFVNPVRKVCDSNGGFALSSDGWGEFTILVKIEWKDGPPTRQQYQLDLHSAQAAPGAPPQAVGHARPAARAKLAAIRPGNTSRQLPGGQWAWTVFVAANEDTLGKIQCVQYTLHPTFPDPIQRVCERGDRADAAFPFSAQGWGTFEVGIKVEFKDGTTRDLRYMLRFGDQK